MGSSSRVGAFVNKHSRVDLFSFVPCESLFSFCSPSTVLILEFAIRQEQLQFMDIFLDTAIILRTHWLVTLVSRNVAGQIYGNKFRLLTKRWKNI